MSLRYIVIDTNIFISAALSPSGVAYQALTTAIQGFTIVYSDETYQEIASRLYKAKFDRYISNERRAEFLNLIQSKSKFIKTTSQITICRDPDDNKFLELAILILRGYANDSNAELLVTGDKDLLILKSEPEYQHLIVSPRNFLELS